MDLIVEGIKKAFFLVFTLDREVLGITLLSIKVSGLATLISMVVGISAGTAVALSRFPGRQFVVSLINTGMGLPPVVVGLFITIFLWRNGPLGFLGILYTPTAIILAQAVIAIPIVTGISMAAIQHLPANLRLQILALGATRLQMLWMLVKEARLPLLAAVMAAFFVPKGSASWPLLFVISPSLPTPTASPSGTIKPAATAWAALPSPASSPPPPISWPLATW